MPSSLPPFHPLRLAARSAAPARLVHQGQLPSSSLGVSANVSRRSLSRTSGPACLPPADSATQPAFAVRQNKHAQHSYSSALVPARFGIRPSSTATGARQHNAGGRGGWGGGAGRGVAVFVRSQVPRTPCVPSLFVHRPVVVFPVCTARLHAALLHDAGGYSSHGSTRRKSTPVCVCRAVGSAAAVRSGHVISVRRFARSVGRLGASGMLTAERAHWPTPV